MRIEQRVQVKIMGAYRPYSYAWCFDPAEGEQLLAIGDRVEIPANQVQEEGGSGVVIALGSDYNGPLREIVRVIKRADGSTRRPYTDEDEMWEGVETR